VAGGAQSVGETADGIRKAESVMEDDGLSHRRAAYVGAGVAGLPRTRADAGLPRTLHAGDHRIPK
jgi:hypothetical protein